MPRKFLVGGPTMVKVRGGQHWASGAIGRLAELGLAQDAVKIEVKRFYDDVNADALGRRTAADVMVSQGEAEITMKLIHYDPFVLACCQSDAMGGTTITDQPGNFDLGFDQSARFGKWQQPAGKLLGNGLPRFASGNYYVGLNLQTSTPSNTYDWRFFYAYLAEQPVTTRLGSEASTTELRWRAVRYAPLWQILQDDGTVARDLGEVLPVAIDPAVKFPFNQSTANAPVWTEQQKNFELANGERRIYTMTREIGSHPDRYVLPLFDHHLDDNTSDGVHQD